MNKASIFEQLKIDEGVRYVIYTDHLGYKTFGVGHLIVFGDQEYEKPVGTRISDERVWEVFDLDVEVTIKECEALYSNFLTWPREVQEILVNMMFNLGRTRLAKFSKFRRALNDNDWKVAAIEGRDSLWYRQVPNRAERLMSRLEKVS